jgi:hypothetical protein
MNPIDVRVKSKKINWWGLAIFVIGLAGALFFLVPLYFNSLK